MQINKIALITNKCTKPCKNINFRGEDSPTGNKERVRYKHYEELSDDALITRSIIKAHQEVQQGGKMRLFKAIPAIATGIVATSLAIAQPGKLSAKAATGLGFLAVSAGIDALYDIFMPNSNKDKKKKAYATLGGLATIGLGAVAVSKASKSGNFNAITNFISKETTQLSKEINKTTLAKLSNKYIEPFFKKHPHFRFAAPIATMIANIALAPLASTGLLKGISKDITEKACLNYQKGKIIQQVARNHFDSVDAIEV